uniref:Amino acid transporter n=1 Tax=Eptatretus burgeri TaxID=7764 RepID=A0A8C4QLK4_EPTBU
MGSAKCDQFWKRNGLLVATIVAVALGVTTGMLIRQYFQLSSLDIVYFSFPGEVLMRMLKLIILPLIVSSMITGLASLDSSASGKIGLLAVLYYLCTTVIAVMLGIGLVLLIKPGVSQKAEDMDRTGVSTNVTAADTLMDLIRNMFPENLIQACFQQYRTRRVLADSMGEAELNVTVTPTPSSFFTPTPLYSFNTTILNVYSLKGEYVSGINVLGLIVFCLVLGCVIRRMGDKGIVLAAFFDALNEATMRMVAIVMWFMPIGIYFLIAGKILEVKDWEIFRQLGLYMATVLCGPAGIALNHHGPWEGCHTLGHRHSHHSVSTPYSCCLVLYLVFRGDSFKILS